MPKQLLSVALLGILLLSACVAPTAPAPTTPAQPAAVEPAPAPAVAASASRRGRARPATRARSWAGILAAAQWPNRQLLHVGRQRRDQRLGYRLRGAEPSRSATISTWS
ncbi:MAG: hypothetical protein V9H69_19420 [Anaerolineae bacterium]